MQITDITERDLYNITINKIVDMAKENIVVMTFTQWQEIITQRTDNETRETINTLFTQLTYLGFFQSVDDKDIFYIGIYTGVEIPLGLVNEWTQIMDLRIATPHTSKLPWIVFRTSGILNEIDTKFIQEFFEFTTRTYTNRNVTIYGVTPISSITDKTVSEDTWYWLYGETIELIPSKIAVHTLFPIPGIDNTVLLVDRARQTHYYTFDPKKVALIKCAKPNTVI